MAVSDKSTAQMSKSFDTVELTEALVLTRTRAPDLESVKKLNCWASNIGDVGVVRRMPALEVCSLSINKITSLRDFAHCHNLKELYVRTNKIERLGDIHYLKHLSRLRSLWLSENPCAGEANYRLTVLRTLPNLRKLDNIVVTEDEVHQAETEGDQIPIPEDFSSSSLFSIEAFNQSKASVSPPDSARSVDSTRSVAQSVGASAAISVDNSVGDSVSVVGSDGRWALPRRKRQQRKREEMLRSSGGEEGGGSARSGEESSGAGDGGGEGGRSPLVSGSSDSHPEEEAEGDTHHNILKSDEIPKEADNSDAYSKIKEGVLESIGGDVSPVTNSVGSDENKTLKYSTVDEKLDGNSSDTLEKTSPRDKISSSAIDVTASGLPSSRPEFPPVPDTAGSINVLRISDLEETSHSETVPSSTSTLIQSDEISSGDKQSKGNNNNNSISNSDETRDVELNGIGDDKFPTASQANIKSASPANFSLSSSVKGAESSLLDKIRLDDSLDVMDSATEENGPVSKEGVTSVDLEQLEVEVDQGQVLNTSAQDSKTNNSMPIPGAGLRAKVGDAASVMSSRQKPIVPVKTKAAHINWQEHNRLRAELGVKPMDGTRSATLPVNTSTEVTKARNSNVLQAVLCLLKELDKDSLDIVGAAVKARAGALD